MKHSIHAEGSVPAMQHTELTDNGLELDDRDLMTSKGIENKSFVCNCGFETTSAKRAEKHLREAKNDAE